MLFGVATPKITSTLLFRALLLHIPVHSSFTPPSFLPLETLISPHKISISRTISFVGTSSGLRKISIWTATFINVGWNYFRLNSSVSNLTNDRKKCSESGYEDSFIAQSSLSCRDELGSSHHAKMSNWFTGKPVRVQAVVGLGQKPTTRVTRYFKINLTSAPLITFLGPANFITVSLPILFSPVLPSISPHVTKFPPLRPRTFRLHKLTRSADYGLARLLAASRSPLKAA